MFTLYVPVRMRRAMSMPRSVSAVQTLPLRPYGESSMRTASASSPYGIRQITGPKISSRAMRIELSTEPKRVGSTYHPRSWEAGGLRAALPDREIVPGELLDLAGRKLRAVWTPGHTPGHVCLHLEERHPAGLAGNGWLFSGDHLLPEISPHIGLYEDPDDTAVTDPLGDYLASLERIGRLGVAEVLPAHQHAFTDAGGRVRELLDHHEERLSGLLALLATPLTPWQLAERMEWNRPWEQIPHGSRSIAVSEAESHLRRLAKLGRAEAVPGGTPVSYIAV